jgi:hypothetical protein
MTSSAIVRRACLTVFISIVTALLWTVPAVTAWAAATERQGPCAADVEKYCKDIPPGQGRLMNCLKEHEKDLSPACKEKELTMAHKVERFRKACEGDVQRLCKDVQPGEGRVIKCLKEHEKELSPDCSASMERGRGMQRQ